MRIVGIAAVIAALAVATASRESEAAIESAETHHDHEGDAHHHGDADDRHESPDSPCEHPEQHCCCPPALTIALHTPGATIEPPISAETSLLQARPRDHVALQRIFHIPIA